MTERQFTETVVGVAHLFGWLAFHPLHSIDRRRNGEERWRTAMAGDPGYPDLTLARGGRVIFAELKTDTGRASKAQKQWLEELGAQGAECYLWRPRDLTDIKVILRSKT